MSQPLRSSLTGEMDTMHISVHQGPSMHSPTKCGQVEIAGEGSPLSNPEYCATSIARSSAKQKQRENDLSAHNTATGVSSYSSKSKISDYSLSHHSSVYPSNNDSVTNSCHVVSLMADRTSIAKSSVNLSGVATLTAQNQPAVDSVRKHLKRKATELEEKTDVNREPVENHDVSSSVPGTEGEKIKCEPLYDNKVVQARGNSEERTVASTVPAGMDEEKQEATNVVHPSRPHSEFFVKDWEFTQTLGEGAYGEVRLAYNVKTKEAVAVKIVDTRGPKHILDDTKKEVVILRMLNHKHVIKFYGVRIDESIHYLFLQYASGGELYDRIEPDVGMPQVMAQKYYRQLIDGLEYIHEKGVTHRDIKPENLLLDDDDNLKIADFGLATIYKYKNKWRMMERMCGSKPYAAPECMIERPYRATPADIWSTGIVLVAMLAGELPWHAAVLSSQEYCDWRECHILQKPWSKIDNLALCLLRHVLVERPSKRYTIEEIRRNQWFIKDFSNDPLAHFKSNKYLCLQRERQSFRPYTCSQPATSTLGSCGRGKAADDCSGGSPSSAGDDRLISFSQPNKTEDLLLNSQITSTQSSQTPLQKLVRRMTRFFSTKSRKEIMEELDRVFGMFGYSVRKSSGHVFTVMTTDKRQCTLTFKATLFDMGQSLLVDFRLSKGDGLEFKRHFIRIRDLMKPIICKPPHCLSNI